MLADAQSIWKRPGRFALVQSLSISNLSYLAVREGAFLRCADREVDERLFDVSVISHKPGGPQTESWQVKLPVTEKGMLCIDPLQDLIITRTTAANVGIRDQVAWFSCSILSLRTGAQHPRAQQPSIHMLVSERVQNKPHYTRVQVFGQTLLVSMASGFQFFTEIAAFDWLTGEQMAVRSSTLK